MKKKINKKYVILCVIVLLVMIGISIYLSCNILTISNYEVISEKLPNEFNNFKILQLSDLHNKYFGKDGYKLIQKIDKISPDMIVMTGDMVNSKDIDYTNFLNIAYNISRKYKVYYVIGNHEEDLSIENREKIYNELRSYGINVLDNQCINIQKDDEIVNIYGLSYDLKINTQLEKKENLNILLSNTDVNEFNILLAHNPLYFEEYAKYNIDLVLSGHVHGGIVRFPFFNGLLSPNETFFPKYSKGEYNINNTKLIVSAGIGIGRMPIRLFNFLDIPVIILKNS